MIEVTYERKKKKLKLTVKGHARSDEPGKDLVCAAASILVYTLAEDVSNLCDDKRRFRRPVIRISEGDSTISCCPVYGMSSVTMLVFDSICHGFGILESKYPEYIKFNLVG